MCTRVFTACFKGASSHGEINFLAGSSPLASLFCSFSFLVTLLRIPSWTRNVTRVYPLKISNCVYGCFPVLRRSRAHRLLLHAHAYARMYVGGAMQP